MNAIVLDGLTKDYGEVLANDDVSFAVERGEIFGYLGPNGAGKTTSIRILLGFIAPTAGAATLLGADVTDEAALIEAKRRVGYLPDDPQFDESATGREILDLHAAIKGDERSEELLELFDPPLDRKIREYSHGNVRKLGLVTTFMHDPDLVILDEPTGGLDPLMKQRFAEFVRRENEAGLTVFFSSHVLGEVRRLCDRVGIIRQGRLVTVEPIESLLDRSGKVVRVVADDPIPRSTFERALPGAFDLEMGVAFSADGTASTDPSATASADGESPEPSPAASSDGEAPESSPTEPADDDAPEPSPAEPADDDAPEPSPADPADGVADESYHEYTFTFTGDVDTLLATLGDYRLHDCTIEEAPLEDVFLRFYGGEDDD